MQLFVRNDTLRRRLEYLRKKGKRIGFCPTMGALHEGHLSLVSRSKQECEITVVSIFVNPTQFNQKSDLDKYPRPIKKDMKLLREAGADILYKPLVREIYPPGLDTKVQVNLGGLDAQLEGAFRPGHFAGVVQVVKRLLDIVSPDKLYMGQKDFQQFTIIRRMIRELSLPVQLVVVPIIRERDNLAMSSRNVRLSPHMRKKALVLHKSLKYAKETWRTSSFSEISERALEMIRKEGLEPEYFSLVDGHSLKAVNSPDLTNYLVALVAAWAGDVRLIDNMILKGGF